MLGSLVKVDDGQHDEDQRRCDGPADLEPRVAVDLRRDGFFLARNL